MFIRKCCISVLVMLAAIINAYAGDGSEKEKVVTNKWSLVFGPGNVVNHYLSNQEYAGGFTGIRAEHGSFYRKSENLSWDLDLLMIMAPQSELFEMGLSNPLGTSYLSSFRFSADYGTSYNWNPVKNLYLKAGGAFEVMAGANMGKPNHINNIISLDFQTQLKAAAGVKYGWNLKKMGIFLTADLAVPFMGLMLVDSQYQSSMHGIFLPNSELLPPTKSFLKFSSFHNLQGYDFEVGIDFVFKHMTFSISNKTDNRWWTSYGLQNYRKLNMMNFGFSVDLVSRSRFNSNNRYF